MQPWPDERTERIMLETTTLLKSEFDPTSAGHDAACHIKALLCRVRELEKEAEKHEAFCAELEGQLGICPDHKHGCRDYLILRVVELKVNLEKAKKSQV